MSEHATARGIRREIGLIMSNTRLVLVRHGESNATVSRSIGGPRTCTGLSPLGRIQAERLRDRWLRHPEVNVDVLMSSAFPRARETAQIIAPALGSMSVQVDPLWGEHDPGPECDGLTYRDFVDRHGMPDWEANPYNVIFPGGETVAEFHHRIGIALHRTVREHQGKTVVVCCHGGVVDAVLRMSLRSSLTGGFEVHTMNTSITEMVEVRTGRWRLVRYNDHGHLAGLPSATSSEIESQQQSAE